MEKKQFKIYEFLVEFFRPTKWKILTTLIFIIIATLGFFGIVPFAYYTQVGDVIVSKPSFLVTGPIYPLIFITDITNISIDIERYGFTSSLILVFIVLLAYYYLVSCLLTIIYRKFIRIR
ncbi:hypothetical protein HYX02_00410 [Candidatus Woesearchaeota archaeon]|nr:hypothetical protein [Candidatus Woesearchaeota archaeon]